MCCAIVINVNNNINIVSSCSNETSNSNKLTSAYVKCMKLFFGFPKYGSVSAMLMQLNLPSFNTVLHNARVVFQSRLKLSGGAVMNAIRLVGCII